MQTFPQPMRLADLRPTLIYFGIAFLTIGAGIVLRFVPLGLPEPLVRYGGSFLWAWMVYFLVAAVLAYRRPWTLAAISAFLATLVEVSRLYHSPGFDAFRRTLAGVLLLGRVFRLRHLVIYGLAIALAALFDGKALRRKALHLKRGL